MVIFLLLAYNEEDNIVPTLQRIRFKMDRLVCDYRVIVIDDGSFDKTINNINLITSSMPINIVRNEKNMGVAFAFKKGLEFINSLNPKNEDIIIAWEADNTNNPQLIEDMIEKLKRENKEIVCASRYIPGGRSYKIFSIRSLLSRTVNFIFCVLFPIREVNDYTHIPRLYLWRILKKLLSNYNERIIESSYFAFSAEMLLKAKKFGADIIQIPHNYQYGLRKGKSKLNILRSIIDYLRLIIKMI
jgi:dolichol-phosphate mannosyltransferase